eukprot:1237893-Pleurochrysis_carterae.AAC.1
MRTCSCTRAFAPFLPLSFVVLCSSVRVDGIMRSPWSGPLFTPQATFARPLRRADCAEDDAG